MIFLALRHLLSRKKQSLLILIGIALGTSIFIFLTGLQLGFRAYMIRQLIENDGHVKITGRDETISPKNIENIFDPKQKNNYLWVTNPAGKRNESRIASPFDWFTFLSQNSDVSGFSELYQTQVLIRRAGVKRTAQLVGIYPQRHRMVTQLESFITEGKLADLSGGGPLVIGGAELLDELGVAVGESIFIVGLSGEMLPHRVVGRFSMGARGIDNNVLYTHISQASNIAGAQGQVSQIIVRLFDVDQARPIADQWSQWSVDKVESWDQANAQFLEVTVIQDLTRNFITVGIVLVASFGIYNVLSIIVNQKRREIAILRSLGYQSRQILELFLTQGLVLGFIGAVLGVVLGYLISYFTMNYLHSIAKSQVQIEIDPMIYLQGILMAVGSSLLAGYIPARAASQMTPIDIIREE